MRSARYLLFAVVAVGVGWFAPAAFAQINSLALFNLRATNIEAMGPNTEILHALIPPLEQDKSIKLMPRRELEEALHQAGLPQSDNPENVLKAGRALGVNFIFFGQVTKKGSQISAQFKLMDIENATLLQTWENTFSGREDILKQVPLIARSLSVTIANRDTCLSAAAPPPKPQPEVSVDIENLRAQSKVKKVVITWTHDPELPILEFNVYRAQKLAGPYQFLGKSRENTFSDSTVRDGKFYCYRLGIILHSGKEIKSEKIARLVTTDAKLPHPPLIMFANAYIRRAEINFVPSLINEQEKFKISEYKIYRRKEPGQTYVNVSTISAEHKSESKLAFTFEDAHNLEDGQIYTYALTSLDRKNRESPFSDLVTVKTHHPPTLKVEAQNLLRKVPLAWQPMEKEKVKGYHIYRKTDGQDWKKIATVRGAEKTEFTDQNDLADGRNYQYYLTVFDAKRESGASNTVQAITKNPPPVPAALMAESGLVKSVKISWTQIEDPDIGGYAIYRSKDNKNFDKITKVKGHQSNTYLDKGKTFAPLEDGQSYYYSISSFNLFGAEGRRTPAVSARTKPRPDKCNQFTVTAEPDHILIRWKPNPERDIKAYVLYRNKNDGSWSRITSLDSKQRRYLDKNLKPEINYRYKIIVEDRDGLTSDPVESETIPSPILKTKSQMIESTVLLT